MNHHDSPMREVRSCRMTVYTQCWCCTRALADKRRMGMMMQAGVRFGDAKEPGGMEVVEGGGEVSLASL